MTPEDKTVEGPRFCSECKHHRENFTLSKFALEHSCVRFTPDMLRSAAARVDYERVDYLVTGVLLNSRPKVDCRDERISLDDDKCGPFGNVQLFSHRRSVRRRSCAPPRRI